MASYYFLNTALPPLELGIRPEMSFAELKALLLMNLTPKDLEAVQKLLAPIDLYNIRALWLGEPLDERGRLNARELEEELLVGDALPPYLVEYLDRYESTHQRLNFFASLYASLYRDELPKLKGFLREYYQFERDLLLTLTALRAKQSGRDLVRELQFEDPTDPQIAEILAQKDAPEYTPPREFEDLKTLFVDNCSDPKKLHQRIGEYRFNRLTEMEGLQDFGIDRVLAYIARFMIAQSFEMDPEKGKEVLNQYE